MGYWGRVVGTTVAVNVAAAVVPAALRIVGVFGRPSGDAGTGLDLVFVLGLVNLVWIVPVFALAAAVGLAAARRGRATGLLVATVLLGGLPFALVGAAFVAEGPELACYALLLHTVGVYRLRLLAVTEHPG